MNIDPLHHCFSVSKHPTGSFAIFSPETLDKLTRWTYDSLTLTTDPLENIVTHLVVDTETGLRIVQATQQNYFNSAYAVQFVGTLDQCKAEVKRLRSY